MQNHYRGLSDSTVQTMIYVKNVMEAESGQRVTSWRAVARHIMTAAPYMSRTQARAAGMDNRGMIGRRASEMTSAARDLARDRSHR